MSLALQRCLHHEEREAVAQCPECTRYYCRECITDHNGRVVCKTCLQKLVTPVASQTQFMRRMLRGGMCVVSFYLLWLFFYYLGEIFYQIPETFHEGTIW